MRSRHCAFLAVLMSVSATSAAAAAARLTPLGDLPGGTFSSYAYGVSGDGSVVVGSSSYSVLGYTQAFRWTSDGGMVGLGDLPGAALWSNAFGVSADGSVIVGWGASASGFEAFRWTSEGGMVGLGYWPGESGVDPRSVANGVSGDGSIVVGESQFDYRYSNEAFRWTSGGGMGGLGSVPPPFFERVAAGVSRDGSVVVGYVYGFDAAGLDNYEAFRWTSDGGMVLFDGHPYGGSSGAYGVNADGSVIVGWGASASGREAFRWTNDGGMVGLGILPGHVSSDARGVSGDGSVVVGISGDAFRWTSDGGMERLWDVLVAHGVDPAADGWTSLYASGISADGNTIVGNGTRNGNTEAFAAFIPIAPELPGDFNFDGNADAADYVVWRKGVGIAPTQENYNLWRSNFGRTSGSGLAASENSVPEPGSLALLTLAIPALLRRRQAPAAGQVRLLK
jgi:probable HAF family extracellular repeat protein